MAVAQRVAHADFTLAAVVVQQLSKIDALIEARGMIRMLSEVPPVCQMIATEPNRVRLSLWVRPSVR